MSQFLMMVVMWCAPAKDEILCRARFVSCIEKQLTARAYDVVIENNAIRKCAKSLLVSKDFHGGDQ